MKEKIQNKFKIESKNDLAEIVFLIAFMCYLTHAFIGTTLLAEVQFISTFRTLLKFGGLGLVLFKIVFLENYTLKEFIIICASFIILFTIAFVANKKILIIVLLYVVGAKNISFRKIVLVFFWFDLFLLLITMLEAKFGLIENLIYFRENETKREAFGIVYPTDFAAYVVYINLAGFYLKGKNIKWYQIGLMFLSAVFVYVFNNARLDTISILLLGILVCLYKKNLIPFNLKLVKILIIISFIICEILILFATINFDISNPIWGKLERTLSGRLSIGSNMYNKHGIKLFGQDIEYYGWGGKPAEEYEYEEYNFIDSSFLRFFLEYGISFVIFITILNTHLLKSAIEKKEYKVIIILMIIYMNSLVAQHYLEFSYNFMLFIFLANWDEKKLSKGI